MSKAERNDEMDLDVYDGFSRVPVVGEIETNEKELVSISFYNGESKATLKTWKDTIQFLIKLSNYAERENCIRMVFFWNLPMFVEFAKAKLPGIELNDKNPIRRTGAPCLVYQLTWRNLIFRNASQLCCKNTYRDADDWSSVVSGRTGLEGLFDCIVFERNKQYRQDMRWIPFSYTKRVRKAVVDKLKCLVPGTKTNYGDYLDMHYRMNQAEYDFIKYSYSGPHICCRTWAQREEYYINSYDIKSSYPYEMLTKKYPKGKGIVIEKPEKAAKVFNEYRNNKECLYILHGIVKNLEVKELGVPFLKKSFNRKQNLKEDSEGDRIERAEEYEFYLASTEFALLEKHYNFEDLKILGIVLYPELDYLPGPIRNLIWDMYQTKKEAKSKGELAYREAKIPLNSIYGLFYRDPLNYCETLEEFYTCDRKENPTAIEIRSFPYQFGYWTCAFGKQSLFELLDNSCIYTDTDCVKSYANLDEKVKELNEKRKFRDSDIGQWVKESSNARFKAWSTRQYITETKDGLEVVMAGADNEAISYYIKEKNIDLFAEDDVIIPKEFSGSVRSKVGDDYRIEYNVDYSIGEYDDEVKLMALLGYYERKTAL